VVNFRTDPSLETLYDHAASSTISSLFNKRVVDYATAATGEASPLSTLAARAAAVKIAEEFRATAPRGQLTLLDLEPTLHPFATSEEPNDKSAALLGATLVGYILTKQRYTPTGKKLGNPVHKIIAGRENRLYIDSHIVYGGKYNYNFRNVYRIDARVNVADPREKKTLHTISFMIASRPSKYISVTTEEFNAPLPPDGLFYRFNYDRRRGLILTWQLSVGRSRDVKYFQIFRRKSIHEPFLCLGEIDFDDSLTKTVRSEVVRSDLIVQANGPSPFFEDKFFDRETTPYIYAVCAVDAHGLTSGYSAQTLVKFDKITNKLVLKTISPPGAPKQYPNFFVDPDLDDNILVDSFSQDAIFDSGHQKIKLYFTPDAKISKSGNGAQKNVLVTDATQGKYKIHILNLDLQKSTTAEIRIQQSPNSVTA
jgi:hypothetical protein